MSKKAIWAISTLLVLALIGLGVWFYLTKDERARRNAVMQLPEISGVLPDGSVVNNEVIEGKKGVLVFISLSCPYCRQEVQDIRGNMEKFDNHPVYLISSEDGIHGDFAGEFDLMDVEGLHLVKTDYKTFRNFQVTRIPQIMVYDRKGRLIERLEGSVPVDDIVAYLE